MSGNTDRLNTALGGRYRILSHLGEGGMATVYLCDDLKHDRKVALKLLKPELAAVLGAERFVQEIKTTAALQHPHILPLFDSGTADGFLIAVPMSGGAVYSAGIPRRLFGAEPYLVLNQSFDVHPDGKRFLMVRSVGAITEHADELIVVENFFEELKAKVPVKK